MRSVRTTSQSLCLPEVEHGRVFLELGEKPPECEQTQIICEAGISGTSSYFLQCISHREEILKCQLGEDFRV